jgi:hypothetical protein
LSQVNKLLHTLCFNPVGPKVHYCTIAPGKISFFGNFHENLKTQFAI